jgi:putative multiple sugar transport system substrate-binding protein
VRKTLTGLLALGLALTTAACGDESRTDGVYANQGATIGIALPNKVQARWIADGENMKQQFAAMGYSVNLQYSDNNVGQQQKQIQAMVEQGNKLLVIGAVDGSSLTKQLQAAAKKKVPVIAYDRLIINTKDVGYQATFDNDRVGLLQGQLLLDRLGLNEENENGPFTIELFAGDVADANAQAFFLGAMKVLKPYLDSGALQVRSGQKAFKQVTTRNYDGAVAGKRLQNILKAYYQNEKLDAVLSANDSMALGLIKALKANGYGSDSKPLPFTSGQDAELTSIKSIINDEQTGTIYKDTRELAKVAVQQGNALLTGTTPITNNTTAFNNGVKIVPTYLLYPVAVDKLNYRKLLVDGGYYKAGDLR